jgi:hypothetical protein
MRSLIVAGAYTQGDDLAWHVGVGNSHLNATGEQILSDCIMAAIPYSWIAELKEGSDTNIFVPYDIDVGSHVVASIQNLTIYGN